MNRLDQKRQRQVIRSRRVRQTVSGSADRPRLSVRLSNRHVTAQLIDDNSQKTLVYVSTVGQKSLTDTLSAKAAWVGVELAKKAGAKKIKRVTFDRGSKLYHGRIKQLAEAARKSGMEF